MTGIRGKLLVLVVIPIILYVVMLNVMPLMEPDEGRYSAIPSYMNKSGDYITPRLKEAVYIEKPPLAYWATALSFKVFGESDFSSRLFTGLCAWGCILLVYAMGRYFYDDKTGLYGAAILTTSFFHFAIGRINILDMPVAFLMSLAIWSGYRYCESGDAYRSSAKLPVHVPQKAWLYLCYFACALAFLTKGLIGFVFPAAILVIWLAAAKRWREIHRFISPLGMVIFLAVTLPWLVLIQQAHGDFFRFFFIQEHLQRYTTTMHHRNEPFYYYLPVLIVGTLPWCAFVLQTLRGRGLKAVGKGPFLHEGNLFLFVWAGFIFLFFSFSSSKLIPYIAAVFLPLAVFQGRIFRAYDELSSSPRATVFNPYHLAVILQSLVFIALLLAPVFLKENRIPFEIWWPWIAAPLLLQVLLIFLPRYVGQRAGRHWFLTVYLLTVLFFASLIFPVSRFLTPYKSAYPLVPAIARYLPAGQELYQYGVCLYGIDFYCKIRTPIVDDIGEVGYGSGYLPAAERRHYFLNDREFYQLCRNRPATYCLTKGREDMEKVKKEFPRTIVLWDNKYYYLLKVET